MKWNFSQNHSSIAFVLLIQLTYVVWSFDFNPCFKCPIIYPEECNCQEEWKFSFNCTKNNEQMSMSTVGCSLFFNCMNVTDGEIFNLFRFNRKSRHILYLTIESCPQSVVSMIDRSILGDSNDFPLNVEINNLKTLPEDIFSDNIHETFFFTLQGNELTTLPEGIFRSLTTLKYLTLKGKLTTLPEKIFDGLNLLYALYLQDNQLETLPQDIFRSQTNLFYLDLSRNKLTALPENIFPHPIRFIELDDNPWISRPVIPRIN